MVKRGAGGAGVGVGAGAGAGEGADGVLGAVGDDAGVPLDANAPSVSRRTAACRTGRIVLVLSARQRVGEPNLDEGLSCDADALRFPGDRIEEVDREIDIDSLNGSPGPRRLGQIDVRGQLLSSVMHLVATRGRHSLRCRGSALLLLDARGGPR